VIKANPFPLIRAHYATLRNHDTGRLLPLDIAVSFGLPVLVLLYCRHKHVALPAAASGGLLTVCGLLSAFLFGAMLQVSQRALDLSDTGKQGESITAHANFLIGLAGNSGYASLVSIFASGIFVVATVTSGKVLMWFSAAGLAVLAHLAVAMLIVMQRIFSMTQERLLTARTGAENPPRPRRMKVVNGDDQD
jgi:hypothetical protein